MQSVRAYMSIQEFISTVTSGVFGICTTGGQEV